MSHADPPADLGILLSLAYQGFVDELRAALAAQGYGDLGRSDGYVFRLVDAEPMSVSGIATALAISKQGAGQIVDDMEARGYLERRPDPADRRAQLIRLSRRGRQALAAARGFHRRYERKLIGRHGAAPVAALRALLGEMAAAGAGAAGTRRVRPM
jgi:DNA-binding MarR family transcriptional regulator